MGVCRHWRWSRFGVFLFAMSAVVVFATEISNDQLAVNETYTMATSQELQGVQGADETKTVVQKTKMRKAGPTGEQAAQKLDRIQKEKLAQYQTINDALALQADYYKARREARADAASLENNLKSRIPQAKGALQKLRSLTDEEKGIISATTRDAQAVQVAESTYNSWRSAVDSLKIEPLTESELAARNATVAQESKIALQGAQQQAQSVSASDITEEDKTTLRQNVVGKGRNILSSIQGIMQEMQKLMEDFAKQVQGGAGGGNPLEMFSQAASGKGAFSPEGMQRLQKSFEGIASSMQGFMGDFGPFLQTVGGLVGETIDIPALPGIGSIGGMSGFSLPMGGSGGQPAASTPLAPQPQQPASVQPQPLFATTPSSPATGVAGGVADTSEGVEAIELYQIDQGTKNMILLNHRGAYTDFSKGKYENAYKKFENAYSMYAGNYVDAYWAGLAAYKMKKKSLAAEWMEKALAINPRYLPALNFRQEKLK